MSCKKLKYLVIHLTKRVRFVHLKPKNITEDLKNIEIYYTYGFRGTILWKHRFILNWQVDVNQSQSKFQRILVETNSKVCMKEHNYINWFWGLLLYG